MKKPLSEELHPPQVTGGHQRPAHSLPFRLQGRSDASVGRLGVLDGNLDQYLNRSQPLLHYMSYPSRLHRHQANEVIYVPILSVVPDWNASCLKYCIGYGLGRTLADTHHFLWFRVVLKHGPSLNELFKTQQHGVTVHDSIIYVPRLHRRGNSFCSISAKGKNAMPYKAIKSRLPCVTPSLLKMMRALSPWSMAHETNLVPVVIIKYKPAELWTANGPKHANTTHHIDTVCRGYKPLLALSQNRPHLCTSLSSTPTPPKCCCSLPTHTHQNPSCYLLPPELQPSELHHQFQPQSQRKGLRYHMLPLYCRFTPSGRTLPSPASRRLQS